MGKADPKKGKKKVEKIKWMEIYNDNFMEWHADPRVPNEAEVREIHTYGGGPAGGFFIKRNGAVVAWDQQWHSPATLELRDDEHLIFKTDKDSTAYCALKPGVKTAADQEEVEHSVTSEEESSEEESSDDESEEETDEEKKMRAERQRVKKEAEKPYTHKIYFMTPDMDGVQVKELTHVGDHDSWGWAKPLLGCKSVDYMGFTATKEFGEGIYGVLMNVDGSSFVNHTATKLLLKLPSVWGFTELTGKFIIYRYTQDKYGETIKYEDMNLDMETFLKAWQARVAT